MYDTSLNNGKGPVLAINPQYYFMIDGSHKCKMVFLYMSSYMDQKNFFPLTKETTDRMCQDLDLKTATIKKHIKNLVEQGFVERISPTNIWISNDIAFKNHDR